MNVSKLIYNGAEKAMHNKSTTNEEHIHSKRDEKQNTDAAGASNAAEDTFGSAPVIEHYNNYSKDGVLGDIKFNQHMCQVTPTIDSPTGMVVTSFNLDAIPENWGSWSSDSIPPDWNQIPHKGMTTLSKDEIKELMTALADKFNNATSEQERGKIARQALTLQVLYASHGSPDNRKELYEQAMKTIQRYAGGEKQDFKHTDPKTLLDYLNERDGLGQGVFGKGMKEGVAYPMEGGGTLVAQLAGSGSAVKFEAENQGQQVTIWMGVHTFVGFTQTPLEHQLQEEINAYWLRAIGHPDFR